MKIKATRNVSVKGQHVAAGDVIDVEKTIAADLINMNRATAVEAPAPVEAPKPEKKTKAKKAKIKAEVDALVEAVEADQEAAAE